MTNEGCPMHSNFEQELSVTLWPKFHEVSWTDRWWNHTLPALKDRYLSVSLQTIPASYCNVARLWFPDHMRPTSCLLLRAVFFWGWSGAVRFHRLVFLLYTYMMYIYIYMWYIIFIYIYTQYIYIWYIIAFLYGRLCIYLQLPGLSPWYFEWSPKES